MKLGEINIFRGVDTTTALGEYSSPSALDFIYDASDSLGYGSGVTNVIEVTNITNQVIQSSSISNFYDVSVDLPNAPLGAYMVMGAGGVWTYEVIADYILPVATSSVLGGVKIGSGISVAIDGTISINPSGLPVIGTPVSNALVKITTDINGRVTATSAVTSGDITGIIGTPITTETDPIFLASPSNGITANQITHWDTAYSWGDWSTEGFITGYTETDPIYSAWDKSTGISITSTQVSDFTSAVNANSHVSAAYLATHNAVTIGTGNGLSIIGQQVSLQLASATTTGALSAADWVIFNTALSGSSFQPLENQRLSTTDSVDFVDVTAQYLDSTAITDDSTSLGSLAGFEAANGIIRRFSPSLVQAWLGLGPNAYTSTEYYLATNPSHFVDTITSSDGSVTITNDILTDPELHSVDLSVTPLHRYNVVTTSGSEVSVLATTPDVTATLVGQTLTFSIPVGTLLVSAKVRFGSYASLIVKMGTNDIPNSSVANRWIPIVQAWREDTRSQLMAVNIVPSATIFDEVSINGLISTTTNHIRLTF